MADDGETKDDVRMPDGEIGDKINKLFKEEEKDTSEFSPLYPSTQQYAIFCTLYYSFRWG